MMKPSFCAIVLVAAFLSVTQGINKNVIIQHKSSQKYIAWFNGVNSALVTFTPNEKNAQRFQFEIDDSGSMWIITSDGVAIWDKSHGCSSDKNYIIYYTSPSTDNQLFTLNNDGTIGSKCCETCLLAPSADYLLLNEEKYLCTNNNITNYQFTIIPVDY